MSFSYDPNLSTDKDLIRFKLGDTIDNGHQLEDEEIKATLVTNVFNNALLECCRSVLAKLAPKVTYSIGPESVSLSEVFAHYQSLYEVLSKQISKSTSAPSPCTSTPIFRVGMHDVH